MNQDFKNIIICLPTYNEADNITLIIDGILSDYPEIKILVIDDNSPDGTGLIADNIADKNNNVSVLHRQNKEGLGKAYIDGFRHAIKTTDCSVIVQMDADFSHSPSHIAPMIQKLENADLVIGSRYVPGGEIENWGNFRRLLSRFGSLYARMWLRVPVNDLTGGYKVWRRPLLEQIINNYNIKTKGYAFQVEMTYCAFLQGGRITESPITFTERSDGKSKMTAGIALEAFYRIPQICCNSRRTKQ
jgi:dolichol-phosphate mannosyltransferase